MLFFFFNIYLFFSISRESIICSVEKHDIFLWHYVIYCFYFYTARHVAFNIIHYFSRSFTWFFIIRYDHDDYERTTMGKKALCPPLFFYSEQLIFRLLLIIFLFIFIACVILFLSYLLCVLKYSFFKDCVINIR